MAIFSINISKEFEVAKSLVKLRDYFVENSDKEALEMISKLKQKIESNIIRSIRITGSIMLSDPDAAFVL